MRRVVAMFAAVGLAASLASSSLAAAPTTPGSGFVGDFDFVADGTVVGHIDAQLWPWTETQVLSGRFRTSSGLGASSAQVGQTAFYHHDTFNEVWFSALEIGTGPTYGAFTGHFVDNFDRAVPDTVEFFGRPIDMAAGAYTAEFGSPYQFHFTVGKGAFVLNVR